MKKYGLTLILLLLCSCGTHRIDENYAASVAKDKLSLSGNVSAQKLSGGFGSTMNFLVTNDAKKYVVRINKNKSQEGREEENHNLKVASDGGYGPQIYCADSSQGVVIMEYLSGKMISDRELLEYISGKTTSAQDLQSDQLYIALAHMLQKIHRGQAFEGRGDYVFREIREKLHIAQSKYSTYVPLTKIEHIMTVIHQTLLPHLTKTTPCHNDLHRGNLIFLRNECKAIDYETASQGDPYFDVATVAASFFCRPEHEKVLFTTYLGRQPSEAEQAKLYLMKQAVWIKWFFDVLLRLAPETIQQFGLIEIPPFMDLAREAVDGKFDLSTPENKLKVLKAQLNRIFDTIESQEFKDAVNLLSK